MQRIPICVIVAAISCLGTSCHNFARPSTHPPEVVANADENDAKEKLGRMLNRNMTESELLAVLKPTRACRQVSHFGLADDSFYYDCPAFPQHLVLCRVGIVQNSAVLLDWSLVGESDFKSANPVRDSRGPQFEIVDQQWMDNRKAFQEAAIKASNGIE